MNRFSRPKISLPTLRCSKTYRSIEDGVIEIDAAAVEVVSELSGVERPTNDKLSIELLGDSKFAGGDRRKPSTSCSAAEPPAVSSAVPR
ncbi:MAG: hypothetical protein IPK01_08450 [Acidobacteria bacterium]|nr:hypothetical protein [Acidobacteriota bacterium]